MKRKSNRKKPWMKTVSGITLLETLITLILVLIGVIFISKILLFGLEAQKKSWLRLGIQQKIQYHCQYLLSRPYDSADLLPGEKSKTEPPFDIHWHVEEISPSLKRITLSVANGRIFKRTCFYKSKHIKNVNAEPLMMPGLQFALIHNFTAGKHRPGTKIGIISGGVT